MINFDSLPKDKPNNNSIEPGRYHATVFKCEMRESKTNEGTKYLNVSFKCDKHGFVNENYFDSDKAFLQYKLGRLLKACNVTLAGEGKLEDVAKVIKGKDVVVDVVVNDKGYGSLDYSGNNEGIYEPGSIAEKATEEAVTVDADINEAIEADVDDDF